MFTQADTSHKLTDDARVIGERMLARVDDAFSVGPLHLLHLFEVDPWRRNVTGCHRVRNSQRRGPGEGAEQRHGDARTNLGEFAHGTLSTAPASIVVKSKSS